MRTLKRRVLIVLLTLLIAYVLLVLLVMVFQRRLIYFPTRFSLQLAETLASKEGFQPWTNRTGEVIGWHLPSRETPAGSVLIIHGNAGCAIDRTYLAKPIHDASLVDVYLLEYPGYGAREGKPTQKSFLTAGEEAFALLSDRMPIHLVSESLGAGVATHLAKIHGARVSGLMMFAPYNNLVSAGQRQMPFLPVSLILRDRFDPAEWLKDYRGPVSIMIAGADEVIPSDLGRKLHDGYAGPKRLQVIEGAHHNDIAGQPPQWWKEVFAFWQQNGQANAAPR